MTITVGLRGVVTPVWDRLAIVATVAIAAAVGMAMAVAVAVAVASVVEGVLGQRWQHLPMMVRGLNGRSTSLTVLLRLLHFILTK
jgi:hypothetical protein